MSSRTFVTLRDVSFAYDSASTPLFAAASAHFSQGFTGIIGANGSGKTTLLRLIMRELQPTLGSIEGIADAVCCNQRTDVPPANFENFLNDWDAEAFELRGRLQVSVDFGERWNLLSHGERKRAQVAHALWQNPSLLALDEPTNHIDAAARGLLLDRLKQYRGIGLLVSHDRDLLDELCNQCLWLEPPQVHVFSGGYSQAFDQLQTQRQGAVNAREKLVQDEKRLRREIGRRRNKAAMEHSARSKRGLAPGDHDAREKIDRARMSDSKAGNPLRQLDGRQAQNQAKLDATRVTKEYETGIWLPGSKSPRKWLLQLEAGSLHMGNERLLQWQPLRVATADRIALTGNNGTGKSTLIRHLLKSLNVPADKIVYLPQEVTASASVDLLRDLRQRPHAELGQVMNVVSRLGSRPDRLLQSEQPSPGEVRKLLFAVGLSQSPHVIVLDEPTNHLDLPSIEALQSALSDCPCALILVSHDMRFIDGVGAHRWTLKSDDTGGSRVETAEIDER